MGSYTIQVYAQNKNGWSAEMVYAFEVKDNTVPVQPLTLTGSNMEVNSGEAFTKNVLQANGGVTPYSYEYTKEGEKIDMNINSSTGEFTSNGITVEKETVYELTVKVTDGKGNAADTKLTLTVKPVTKEASKTSEETSDPAPAPAAQDDRSLVEEEPAEKAARRGESCCCPHAEEAREREAGAEKGRYLAAEMGCHRKRGWLSAGEGQHG